MIFIQLEMLFNLLLKNRCHSFQNWVENNRYKIRNSVSVRFICILPVVLYHNINLIEIFVVFVRLEKWELLHFYYSLQFDFLYLFISNKSIESFFFYFDFCSCSLFVISLFSNNFNINHFSSLSVGFPSIFFIILSHICICFWWLFYWNSFSLCFRFYVAQFTEVSVIVICSIIYIMVMFYFYGQLYITHNTSICINHSKIVFSLTCKESINNIYIQFLFSRTLSIISYNNFNL